MPGLIDSTTGLKFGTGLIYQTGLGGGGLTIVTVTINAPVLSLDSAPGTSPPELLSEFDGTVLEGDTLVLQYASNIFFIGAAAVTHVLDAGDIVAGEYLFTTPTLGDGLWYFRSRDTRGSLVSGWSNVVTDTIVAGDFFGARLVVVT